MKGDAFRRRMRSRILSSFANRRRTKAGAAAPSFSIVAGGEIGGASGNRTGSASVRTARLFKISRRSTSPQTEHVNVRCSNPGRCSRPREPAPRASLRRKLSTASNYPLLRLLVIKPCDDGGRPLVRRFSTILYPVGLIWLLQENQGACLQQRARRCFRAIPRPVLPGGHCFAPPPPVFAGAWIITGVGEVAMAGFPQRQPRRRGRNGRHEERPRAATAGNSIDQAASLADCSSAQFQGMRSARREAGQRLPSLVSTSVK